MFAYCPPPLLSLDYKIEYEYFFSLLCLSEIPAPHTQLRLQHYVILSITFLFVAAYVSTESFEGNLNFYIPTLNSSTITYT